MVVTVAPVTGDTLSRSSCARTWIAYGVRWFLHYEKHSKRSLLLRQTYGLRMRRTGGCRVPGRDDRWACF
jgi:hypothetical protein